MCTTHHHSRRRPRDSEPWRGSAGGDRVSDADREQTASALQSALIQGLLDVNELEERLERTWAARTREDLAAVTGDLRSWLDQEARRPRRSPRSTFAWTSLVPAPIVIAALVAALICTVALTATAASWLVWWVVGIGLWMARHGRIPGGRASRAPSA